MMLIARPGTTDSAVFREVLYTYGKAPIGPDDVVLDLGAHVGASVAIWRTQGARVIAVEPDEQNFAALQQHWGDDPKVELINAAASRESGRRTLYVNKRKGKDWHTTLPTRGRGEVEVRAVALDELLERYIPTVLKVDIECGEYELFEHQPPLPGVRMVLMEVHFIGGGLRDGRERGEALLSSLEHHYGFRWVQAPRLTPKAWSTVVIGERDVA